jgi:diguanylate cyclase (GGDEF)-like protein/PAS domain S-box-containing protein
MGLVSLAAFLLLVADLIFGLLPDEADIAKHVRKRTSEALAVQLTALVQTEQWDALRRTMHAVISRDPEVLSIGVRRSNGEVVAETGNHATHWVPPANNKSTLTSVLVPIDSGKEIWGRLEVAYRPTTPQTLLGWLKHPGVALTLLLLTVGFGVFYLYLKRILQRLDPNAAIPDRVRTAFDALSEGVLVIDKQGHILLANSGFRKLHPLAGGELTGKRIKDLAWLVEAVGAGIPPWSRAMLERTNVSGETIQIAQEEGEPSKVVINVTPIVDDRETVRGCLITFDDLSTVEHMNQALLDSVAQLEVAKQKIELQNVELKRLADHDQLTGSLTRRAFLEQAQQAFLKSAVQRSNVCVVMMDIDHFKSINDRYGHLVGDQAIQNVAGILAGGVRPGDIVCRYGGEEFCLLLAGIEASQTQELAERMRKQIETGCGPAVVPGDNVRITASFGVASIQHGATTLAELIKQADQALYAAKAAGRNRVLRHDQALALNQALLAVNAA